MKYRFKKKRPVRKRSASAILKKDPTRTITQRRFFAAILKRQFARIKAKIVALIVKEDAFALRPRVNPLTGNVFCPTGQGGGVDPTCSPSGEQIYSPSQVKSYSHSEKIGKGVELDYGTAKDGAVIYRWSDEKADKAGQWTSSRESAEREGKTVAESKKGPVKGFGAKWEAGLNSKEKEAFVNYTLASDRINSALRGGSLGRHEEETVTHLDSAIQRSIVPKEMTAFRGMSSDPGWNVGEKFSEQAYGSVSGSRTIAEDFADRHGNNGPMMELILPKGSKAAQVSAKLSPSYGSESEILLPRGSTYVIKGKRQQEGRTVYSVIVQNELVANTRFQFHSSPDKISAFQDWLRQQFAADLTGATEEQLWAKYIDQGFRKGAGRAFDDVRRSAKATATSKEKLDFYAGSREEFLRSSFANPVSVDKVKLLAGRAFDELEGVTDQMSVRMSRVLTDALVEGMNPEEAARELAEEVDIGFARASTIARTELVRSHAEGQLTAMEKMGIAEVGVEVEWIVTDDEKLCPECASMQGATFTIEEAHGLIPAHPNCRCSFTPSGKSLYSSGKEDEGDDTGLQFSIT